MHSAPAVAYPVARSARAGLVLAVLAGLAAAPVLWWVGQGAPLWPALLAWAAWAAAATGAWLQWRRMPKGELRWDGQAWWWADARGERAIRPRMRLDLQSVILVQADGSGGWHCLESRMLPSRWGDLRRALCASESVAAVPAEPA